MKRIAVVILFCSLFACSENAPSENNNAHSISDTLKVMLKELSADPKCWNIMNEYYDLHGVSVSKFYSVFDSLNIDLDHNGVIDYLYVFTPNSLQPKATCQSQIGKRELVEFINKGSHFVVRNRYPNLISSIGGVMSKYSGLSLDEDGFMITHESGSRYSWKYSTIFTTQFKDSIYLSKIEKTCLFETNGKTSELTFSKKSIENFDIMDTLQANCNCDPMWEKLDQSE